jgi:DNA-binding MarR family transcriptional regulator
MTLKNSDSNQTNDSVNLGLEARVVPDDHLELRLWLRLLSCSTQIEQAIRSKLRTEFSATLPRFDYLAQLERHPKGLRMNAVSRFLMVSDGNITLLTDQLLSDGWIVKNTDPKDRRASIVKLTTLGRKEFKSMAKAHENWLKQLLGGIDTHFKESLYETLGLLRDHLSSEMLNKYDDQPLTTKRGKR